MYYNVPALHRVDATNGSWFVVVEMNIFTVLYGDCWESILRIYGYGDIFAGDELLGGRNGGRERWREGEVEGER